MKKFQLDKIMFPDKPARVYRILEGNTYHYSTYIRIDVRKT